MAQWLNTNALIAIVPCNFLKENVACKSSELKVQENQVTAIDDALAIWNAGVQAVQPANLIANHIELQGNLLSIRDQEFDLSDVTRLVVVGGGKASAELAIQLFRQILQPLQEQGMSIEGWINCPEKSFDESSDAAAATRQCIQLCEARPAGINQPTEKAVAGTKQILKLVSSCGKNDLVISLISGGGSALLASPRPPATLADKQTIAKCLAAAGANIEQLNTVRRALSEVKGGGLARACTAPRMMTLIVSDVLGDSLETIASGPTDLNASSDAGAALAVINELNLAQAPELAAVMRALESQSSQEVVTTECEIHNIILGNNADAVDAAGVKAVELGYRYVMECATQSEGDVSVIAEHAVRACNKLTTEDAVDCWISGGEPTVSLPENPGKGGRNQQLALQCMLMLDATGDQSRPGCLAFVSGGTDGEDGPTDAAGAFFDRDICNTMLENREALHEHHVNADAYSAFERFGALLKTGPTGTNVCDLRVALFKAE